MSDPVGCSRLNHDWRVDLSSNIVLTSDPPQQRVICAGCGATSWKRIIGRDPKKEDVGTWPQA